MKKILLTILSLMLIFNVATAQKGRNFQEKKFVFMTSLGFSSGVGQIHLPDYNRTNDDWKIISNKITNVMIHQFIGYQFNNYFYMGVGAGIDIWNRTAFIPLYLNLSVNMIDKKVAPVAYVNMGYSFKWYMQSTPEAPDYAIHGSDMGPMGEAGLGLRVKFNSKLSLVISGVYKAQLTSICYTSNQNDMDYASIYTDDVKKNQLYHFAGVRVGLMY